MMGRYLNKFNTSCNILGGMVYITDFKTIFIINYLNMYVELLNALEIKLSWYDTFNSKAQNLKGKTMMLNDIRSRDNWMWERSTSFLNQSYAKEKNMP